MQNNIKTAFVLAAGFGKRLKPLTNITSKPLLPIGETSLLFLIFDKLIKAGIKKIIVNTHHLPEEFDSALIPYTDKSSATITYKGAQIIKIFEPEILDTGGGIKNAYDILKDEQSFLVHNGDILFTANIENFINFAHKKITQQNVSAVLCLRNSGHLNNVGVSGDYVCDMRSTTNLPAEKLMQYTGVFVANSKFLEMAKNYPTNVFSTVDIFLQSILKNKQSIPYYLESKGKWDDIGTPKQYLKICKKHTPNLYTYLAQLADFGFIAKNHTLIQKGASTRTFLRFTDESTNKKLVACFYDLQKREDSLYTNIAKFLFKQKIAVPQIIKSCARRRVIVMQDGGSTDLLSIAQNNVFQSAYYYGLAIENIRKLHTKVSEAFHKKPFELSQPFNDNLYEWEQTYFKKECLESRFNIFPTENLQQELNLIKQKLLAQPLVLLHRDFQSQNIMITDREISLIDFQGMRLGCAFYDVASLLFDPYVDIPDDLIDDLLKLYLRATPTQDQLDIFYISACQRLMQALGAYGFLSIKRKKTEYTQYFKPASQRLLHCAKKAQLQHLSNTAQAILNSI